MKADAINDQAGSLGYIDCPKCKNKGFIAFVRDGNVITRECECQAKRRTLKNISVSGLSDMVCRYTFDTYETPSAWQKTAKGTALKYMADGKWFCISGTPGSGKTHLCVAIAGALLNAGREVSYLLWRDEAPALKALVNDRAEYERRIERFKRVDVLYIDDFLKGSVSAADINLAFEIINARYNNAKLMTIISSERTIEEMLDIDEAVGSRIYERCKGFYIKAPNENWRLR